MKTNNTLLTIIMLAPLSLFAHWANSTSGESDKTNSANYACALISNGSLSTQIDNLGVQKQKKYVSFKPAVAWQGRTYAQPNATLISFGYFDTKLSVNGKEQNPVKWEQSLNNKEAFTSNKVDYADATIETIAFVPMQHDMLVVKKIITPKSEANLDFDFIYTFSPKTKNKPRDYVQTTANDISANCATFSYTALGHVVYKGQISILSDAPSAPNFKDKDTAVFSSKVIASPTNPFEITYFITYNDDFKLAPKQLGNKKSLELAKTKGFDGLFADHKDGWAKYWEGSHINIPNKEIEKTYYTGLYHQRCNSTHWSLPVGIFADSHWNGRYFAWDEAFNAMSLATSGKFDHSCKPSNFRTKTLRIALFRANKPNNMKRAHGARFVWQSLEDGNEGGRDGFWIDHIFHMSNIVMETWGHYLYTNDIDFLKHNYELMVECALYYVKNYVYEFDGKFIVGKCTDLERMGPAKENPFMTACGVIYSLEKTAQASKILGVDEDMAKEFLRIAEGLRKNLPNDGEKYVPYPTSKDYSIGSVGGYYPYLTIKEGDKLGEKAVYDFHKNIHKGGNMYAMGKGVNAWYAGWMSSALVQFNDKENPAKLLDGASKETGAFYDTYEINEPQNKAQRCPWFSTGSGNYVYAVNQMLVRPKENGEIMICSSIPDSWNDVDFNLPSHAGLWVNANIKNGKLVSISLDAKGFGKNGDKRTVVIPERFVEKDKIIGKWSQANGYYRIEAQAGKKFYK